MLNHAVRQIDGNALILSNGETLSADNIVVATEAPQAARLLNLPAIDAGQQSTTCLDFSTGGEPPTRDRLLILNGNHDGPINSIAVMSQVAPRYAPPGKHLMAVSLVGPPPADPLSQVIEQLKNWYKPAYIDQWEHLATYQVSHGLPDKSPAHFLRDPLAFNLPDNYFLCGDHLATASQNGALASGRMAAERVLARMANG